MVIRSLCRTGPAGLTAVLAAAALATAGTAAIGPAARAASGWQPTGEMSVDHRAHGAVVLPDGDALVISGFNNSGGGGEVAEVERYDTATGTWSLAAPLPEPRHYATATALADGRVLYAGGFADAGVTASSDLFDPVTGRWSATPGGSLNVQRNGHSAVLLPNGEVLVMGGSDGSRLARPSSEVYDPVTGMWALTSSSTMSDGRDELQAAPLPGGRVLAAGGYTANPSLVFHASADVYDAATDSWTPTAPMHEARAQGAVAALDDGRVLVAGGVNRRGFVHGIELYDPVSGTWSQAGRLPALGNVSRAVVLDDGRVLLQNDGSRSTWLFDPASGTITRTYESGAARVLFWPLLLHDGRVLVAGGSNLSSAELFTPPTERSASGGGFGEVHVGESAERDVTVTNAGGNRLWIDGTALGGAAADDYAIAADGCTGAELEPAASCVVRVRFTPSAVGARTAELTFDDNAEGSPAAALAGGGRPDERPPPVDRPRPPVPDPPRPPAQDPPLPPQPRPVLRAPAIERFTLDRRCVRPLPGASVKIGLGLRLTRHARVRFQVARALGTTGRLVCPPRGSRGTFEGDLGRPLTLTRGTARNAAASSVLTRHTLTLRLRPALYRITARPYTGGGRLGRPAHRWLRVLAP